MVTHPRHILPLQLDVRDPNFAEKSTVWRARMRAEIVELVTLTKKQIAESKSDTSALRRRRTSVAIRTANGVSVSP
jgi:hypothetical protein